MGTSLALPDEPVQQVQEAVQAPVQAVQEQVAPIVDAAKQIVCPDGYACDFTQGIILKLPE